MGDCLQDRLSALRADPFACQLSEGQDEIGESRIGELKQMNVEMKRLVWQDGLPIQVSGTEYEWTRPVCEPARTCTIRLRLEGQSIWTGTAEPAVGGLRTIGNTREFAKYGTKRASENIARFSQREKDALVGE